MDKEKYKLMQDPENKELRKNYKHTSLYYSYRGIRVIQDRSTPTGYWGRWRTLGFTFADDSWANLKIKLDNYLEDKN